MHTSSWCFDSCGVQANFLGGGNKAFSSTGCASGRATYENLVMNGSEVFRFAVRAVPKVRLCCTSDFGLLPTTATAWHACSQHNVAMHV